MSKGTSYKTAIKKMGSNEKIIFGNYSEKWHVINSSDRDFNTSFALSLDYAKNLTEIKATLISARK